MFIFYSKKLLFLFKLMSYKYKKFVLLRPRYITEFSIIHQVFSRYFYLSTISDFFEILIKLKYVITFIVILIQFFQVQATKGN